MNQDAFLKLINRPADISENDLEKLEEIVNKYPYCQVAHVLIAKYAQEKESILAPQKIKKAAMHTYNRNTLRKFLNGNSKPNTVKINIPQNIQAQTNTPEKENLLQEKPIEENLIIEKSNEQDYSKSFFDTLNLEDDATLTAKNEDNLYLNDTITISNEKNDAISEIKTQENPSVFFEGIENISNEKVNMDSMASLPEHPDFETVNEGKALGLFYEGKKKEAVQMYRHLMEMYPEKSEYYHENMMDLVGNKYILREIENTPDTSEDSTKPTISDVIAEPEKTITAEDFNEIALPLDIQTPTAEESIEVNKAKHLHEEPISEFEQDFFDNHSEAVNQITEDENEHFAQLISLDAEHDQEEIIDTYNPLEEVTPLLDVEENTIITEDKNKSFFDTITDTSTQVEENGFFESIEPKAIQENEILEIPRNFIVEDELSQIENKTTNEIAFEIPIQSEEINNQEEEHYYSESEAILLFNQGKNQEAIFIYEKLIQSNPSKANYYANQIQVLKGFINKIDPLKNEKAQVQTFTPDEVSEKAAIAYFTQGRITEAILMYEKLMEAFPDKRKHFASQIDILKS